jgi:hypothetical protein
MDCASDASYSSARRAKRKQISIDAQKQSVAWSQRSGICASVNQESYIPRALN